MKHTDVVKYFVSQKETNLQEQHNVCQIILTIMTEGSNPSFSTNIKQVYGKVVIEVELKIGYI